MRRGAFHCCRWCVPPKRNPYCHSYCPDYLKEKEIFEAKMEKIRAERAINSGLYEQRTKNVVKAFKEQKRGRKFFDK
jgi:hypothetical protein